MSTTETRRSPEELARLGADVFDRRVRPALRPEDDNRFVAVDVGTGTTRSMRIIMRRSRDSGPAVRRPRSGWNGPDRWRHTGWAGADDPRRGHRSP
jgi:hypothetical protein